MCARFSLFATPAQIAELLDLAIPEVEPQYNIAPTETILGAIERDGIRQIRQFRWGLIPSWAKDASAGNRMINARSETVLEKAAFRSAFQRRRCVIPASGFFEWKEEKVEAAATSPPSLFDEVEIPRRTKGKLRTLKQPYFIDLKSHELFAFAGLYEYWRDPASELIRSCTILTTRPNEVVEPLHNRMPVMLRKPEFEAWLDCENPNLEIPESLLAPLPAEIMEAVPVSPAVNDPKNKSEILVL